jgi:hypothetical protein
MGRRFEFQPLAPRVVDALRTAVLREQVERGNQTLLSPAIPAIEKQAELWAALADVSRARRSHELSGREHRLELQEKLLALAARCLAWVQSIDVDEPSSDDVAREKREADQ